MKEKNNIGRPGYMGGSSSASPERKFWGTRGKTMPLRAQTIKKFGNIKTTIKKGKSEVWEYPHSEKKGEGVSPKLTREGLRMK